jgi:hypothetical protein
MPCILLWSRERSFSAHRLQPWSGMLTSPCSAANAHYKFVVWLARALLCSPFRLLCPTVQHINFNRDTPCACRSLSASKSAAQNRDLHGTGRPCRHKIRFEPVNPKSIRGWSPIVIILVELRTSPCPTHPAAASTIVPQILSPCLAIAAAGVRSCASNVLARHVPLRHALYDRNRLLTVSSPSCRIGPMSSI